MTIKLHVGDDENVARWLSERCGNINFGKCTAIGLLDGDEPIGAVVYNNYIKSPSGEPVSIEISIFTSSKKWCTRSVLHDLFAYPFLQLGVRRLQSTCSRENTISRNFLSKIGFHYEGLGREAWPLGGDCVIYSMLKNGCKWLNHGKIST